jgi:hypothetical protein
MSVDITGFQRMRREQEARQQEAAPAWESMAYNELRAAAKEAGIEGYNRMKKGELIEVLKSR